MAAAPPAIWDGGGGSSSTGTGTGSGALPFPHPDRPAARDVFSQALLPPAHAHPHFWQCSYLPRHHNIYDSPQLSFVSPDGVYGIGDTIRIRGYNNDGFGTPVNTHSHTRLALETGDVDRFAVWQNTDYQWRNVWYTYTVQPGDYSDDLDYKSSSALHYGTGPNSNTLDTMNCWLSTPGTRDYDRNWNTQQAGNGKPSLAVNHNIIVDGIIPRVDNVTTASGAYGTDSQVNVTVNFGEPVFAYGPPPSLALALDGANVSATFLDGNMSSSLVFNYTVRQGDLADDLDYAGAGALALATNGSLTDRADNDADLSLPEPGSPGSLGATSNASITAASGEVVGVASPLPDGTYPAGYRIAATVTFSEPVVYSGTPPPSLVLNLSGASRTASYASGNNTRSLAFNYTVLPGDPQVAGLDYAGAGALQAGGGGLRDRAGDAVDTALPWQNGAGTLGSSRSIGIDPAAAAYVTGVDSPGGDTTYGRGDTVRIAVEFSASVAVTGEPALALATGPPSGATYAGGTGTSTLVFDYAVRPGDTAAGLDYAGPAALSLGGGAASIRLDAQGGANAVLALPAPGDPGSLGRNRDIAIDGAGPAVVGVTSTSPDGAYGTGRIVGVTVAFDEPVVVKGEPAPGALADLPGGALYAGGNGTNKLDFVYAVQPGDSAAGPGRAMDSDLALGGGAAIRDELGNMFDGALALPSSRGVDLHGYPAPVLAAAGWAADGQGSPRFDRLKGPTSVAVFKMGENATFAVVTSDAGNGVQLIRIHENGDLRAVSALGDTAAIELQGPIAVDTIDMGDAGMFAVVASRADNGVQLVRIHENGALEAAGHLDHDDDPAGLELLGARSVDAFWTLGGRAFALVASHYDNGVQLVRIHANGTLEAAGTLDDGDGDLVLRGAGGVTSFRAANGTTLALVASFRDNGVQLVRVDEEAGTLRPVGSATSGDPGLGHLYQAITATAMQPAGEVGAGSTLVMVSPEAGDHVQLLRVHDNGTIEGAGSAAAGHGDGFDELWRPKASDFFTMGGRTFSAVVSADGDGVQLIRVHGNGTLEGVDSATDGLDGFDMLDGAHGIDVFKTADGRTFALVGSWSDNGVQLIRLSPASVTGVDIAPPGVTYPLGYPLEITVSFDAPVSVLYPPPSLVLAFDGRNGTADYLTGSGTTRLVFNYTVQPGDMADHLEHAGPGVLVTRGDVVDTIGTGLPAVRPPAASYVVKDMFDVGQPHHSQYGLRNLRLDTSLRPGAAVAANIELPAAGSAGPLGPQQRIGIDSSAAAYVTGVSSPSASGTYEPGRDIYIDVRFSVPVDVAGEPRLALAAERPRYAAYDSGTGTSVLSFRYEVRQGDGTGELEYADAAALSLEGGTVTASIRDRASGTDAVLALPAPGADGSLGSSSDITFDAAGPLVERVASPDADGVYGTGRIVSIAVHFDEPAEVDGVPLLGLATEPPRYAAYASGSGTKELTFLYTVQPGDDAADLDHAGIGALHLNGATISDALGNEAAAGQLSLPARGSPGSLAASGNIEIRGAKLPVLAMAGGSTAAAGTLEFTHAHRPAVFKAGNGTYAVVTSYNLEAALLARVHENGTLEAVDQVDNAGDRALNGAIGVAAFNAGNGTYAVVGPRNEPGVQLLRVHPGNETLGAPYRLADAGDRALNGAIGVDAFEMGHRTYVLAASLWEHGVQLVEAHPGNDTLSAVSRIVDSPDLILRGAAAVAAFEMGGLAYAAVASSDEHGVQLVRIHENGTLKADPDHKVVDNATLALLGPLALDVLEAGDGTYAIVAARDDSGVQLVRIHEDGRLEAAGSLADADDPAGLELAGPHGVDAFEMGNRAYAIVAARDDDGVQLVRIHEDGRLAPAGSAADGAALSALDGAHGIDVFSMANRTYALVASTDDNGVQLIRLSPASVTGVSSALSDGEYPQGYAIRVAVEFDEPVSVSGPPPTLLLALGEGSRRTAEYVSGSGTRSLEFAYTTQPGDEAARMDHAGTAALTTRGIIADARSAGAGGGTAADLELPAPGSSGSLAARHKIAVDGQAGAYVAGVSTPNASGSYAEGDSVDIAVRFSVPVDVAGAPALALNTEPPRHAAYASGSGTEELSFRYTVQAGDNAASLDYAGTMALDLDPGDSLSDRSDGAPAVLALPLPGGPGSLGRSKDIAIDTAAPRLLAVSSPNPDGTYSTGRTVNVTVAFGEPVFVESAGAGAAPALSLNTEPPRHAAYASGSGTDELSFLYTVQPGDSADDLDHAGAGALRLNGAAIADLAGNRAADPLPLPPAGSQESLAASGSIEIRGARLPVLAAAGSATDGQDGFDTLQRAHGVAAFEMGGRAYAVVASVGDNAVQLVRIHEDGTLERAYSLADGTGLSLGEPNAVDAFKMGNRTYAITASWGDGVQLVRIHGNETMSAAPNGSAADDQDGFDTLGGALGVDAFALGSRTYAIVASAADNGVELIRVHGNGTLEHADSLSQSDEPGLVLTDARGVRAFEAAGGNRTYAVVASQSAGVQAVRVHENGTLEAVSSLADNSTLVLDGARGVDVIEAAGGNRTYAVVSSYADDGVQLLHVHANGTLEPVDQMGGDDSNSNALELNGAAAAAVFAMGGRTYAAVASWDDDGVQLVRIGDKGGNVFAEGSAADGQDFPVLHRAYGIDTFEMGGRTYAIVSSEHDHGVQLIRLSPASVASVSSALPGGEYPPGQRIGVAVEFDEPVSVSGPPPSLLLALDNGNRTAEYVSGSGTRLLEFSYTAQPGDNAAALDYAGTAALETLGIIADARGAAGASAAYLELPAPGGAGSLGHFASISVNGSRAHAAGVSSPNASGFYVRGNNVDIIVEFSVPVDVAGEPALALNTEPPRNATYASGTGTDNLRFRYTVQAGDKASDLDYAGIAALALDVGDAIRASSDGAAAGLALPPQGGPGSLGHSKDIAVDATAPRLLGASSPNPDGVYGTGRIVNITVEADEPVVVGGGGGGGGGAPSLSLNTEPPRHATYASGNGTNVLSFLYTVQPGDEAADLDYAGAGALRLNGAAIADLAGNRAADPLLLPPTGSQESLAASKDIVIRGARLPVLAPAGHLDDDGDLRLAGAHRAAVYADGKGGHVAVVSSSEGVQTLRVHGDGTLESIGGIASNTPATHLEPDLGIDAVEAGGRTYAIVASRADSGVQSLHIRADDTLDPAHRIGDGDGNTLELSGAIGVDAFDMGGRAYALVASVGDNGVQLLRVHANGTLEPVDELDNAGPPLLGGAHNVDVFKMDDNRTYALVASWADDGVQLLHVHANGTLEPVDQIGGDNSNSNALELNGAIYADVFEMGGRTYAAVVSTNDDGVQILRIHANGALEAAGRASDGGGFSLKGPHGVDAFEMGGATYAAVAARTDDGIQLVRVHDDGTTLTPAGLASDGARFPRLDGPHHVDVFEAGGRTYALALSQYGGAGVQLIRLSPASVAGVSSPVPAGGTYGAGHRLNVTVEFDGPVSVLGPPPTLLLALGGRNATAEYLEGNGTARLVFNYTIRPGDNAAALDYAGPGALTTLGIVADERGAEGANAADLELPAPGERGSLGYGRSAGIDAPPPAVVSVYLAAGAGGTHAAGSTVGIAVSFTKSVSVTGTPLLGLSTDPPRSAEYVDGTDGDAELLFEYMVQDGDRADPLNYANRTALVLNGGTIGAADDGRGAGLALPAPDGRGLLGPAGSARIDGAAPRVAGVAEADPKGAPYGEGDTVRIAVAFDGPVAISDGADDPSLRLALDGGAAATAMYERLSDGGRSLVFGYVVQEDDAADPLDYDGADALSAGAGDITDAAGNPAVLALPFADGRGLLGGAGSVRIDGAAPRVVSVSSPDGSGAYGPGRQISIEVSFGEPVDVTGTPALALSTIPVRSASYVAGTDGDAELGFAYTVQPGDDADRLGYANSSALSLGGRGGAIVDAAGNDAVLRLPEPGGPASLARSANIAVDTAPPAILSAAAVSRSEVHVAFGEPVESGGAGAGAGWSVSGPDAAGLGIGAGEPVPPSAPVTVLELAVAGGRLPDAAPDIALHYDDGAGGIRDEAGNRLPGTRDVQVADRIPPGIAGASALIAGPNLLEIRYTEPVSAAEGAYSDLYIAGSLREIDARNPAALDTTHRLGFGGGEAPLGSTGSVTIDQTAVRDGADMPNQLGADAAYVLPVFDGRVLGITSSAITGPDTAVITYTRDAEAGQGAYASLVVDGLPRSITGLDGGGGTAEHTLRFSPGGAPAHATGSVLIDAAAVSASSDGAQLGTGAISRTLSDGQPPSVRAAVAVSRGAVNVTFDEAVESGGTAGAGWAVSGGDADGLAIGAGPGASAASAVLQLALVPGLPGTAPRAVTLSYSPAALGGVADPAGNPLGALSVPVGDGIAPEIVSAAITGPSEAEIAYSEPARAHAGAYVSVSPSDGLGARAVTGLGGNGTGAHTIAFGGEPAAPGTEGTIRMDEAAVRDASGNSLGSGPSSRYLRDGQGPAQPPAPPGHASVERAVFTARNAATIAYSAALGPPPGHGALPVYSSVSIDGEDGARPVSGARGVGTAVHTVAFEGAGIGRNHTGAVALAVDLAGGSAGTPLRFEAGRIQVAAGRTVHTVIVSQEQPDRTVAIEPDGFTRVIDATAAGPGARPAVDVSGLAAESEPGSGVRDIARFPPEPVTLATASAAVEFPPGATARPVPPGGAIFLRTVPGALQPPAAAVAAALGYADAAGIELGTAVEAAAVGGGSGGGGGAPVVFDRPVRILLADQSGGRAFYVNGSAEDAASALAADGAAAVAPIDAVCESDDADAVHGQLGGAGECQLDVPGAGGAGGGKAIYTYHLTVFGTVRAAGQPPAPADRPEPESVSVLQRAGGDPLRAPASYSAGDTIVVAVRFTAPVAVDGAGGAPYLELRTGSAGARAAYSSGGGTDELEFEYVVRGGDIAARLSYAGTGALNLNGGAIAAAAAPGALALIALPEPGERGSLSHAGSPAVRIDPEPGRPVLQVGILDDEDAGAGGIREAALAAAYEFNERQGRAPGALIVGATAYGAGTTAGSAAEALRAAHSSGAGPSVYVGPSTDRGLHAAMPYAAEHGIVLASAGSTAPSLAVEGDMVFRLLPTARLDAEALARLALGGGAGSMHAVLENATHGPPTSPAGTSLEDATPPPPGRFSHAFDAALAYAGVPALEGTVTLEGSPGSYGAAAAAEALDASVRAGPAPAAVVYMGSPQGLAALAEASAGYAALESAAWLATGQSAGSMLLAGGGTAAAFAAQAGLAAALWSVPESDAARRVDSLAQVPAGADPGVRHRAYAAYDAVLVVAEAAAEAASRTRGGDAAPDAAAVADRIPDAAAAYSGALGDIALDHAGDLWVPAAYDLWTVTDAAEWSVQMGELDEERACSIALTRAKIDYGPIDSGQTSRPHLQTIVNTGQLPFSRVDLTATPWHVDSPGGCAPGDSPSLPVGLSEIRTEIGGRFLDLAASGTVLARGLEAGGQAPLWYRLSLVGYADLPQAQITQCATYVVRCG